jgi:hypothetical protein
VLPDQATPNRETILSKAGKKVKTEAKVKATEYAKRIFPGAIPAYQMAGERVLPSELIPTRGNLAGEGLLPLLKGCFRGLADGFKRTLGFAIFTVVSFLPGLRNGYWLGIMLMVAGEILLAVSKNKKEADMQ